MFVPVKVERETGLLQTISDNGVEYGLLQLTRYSSLYGARDFWLTWRTPGQDWAKPVFTGVVYQFAPPEKRYIPSKVLRFEKQGEAFVLELGVSEEKRAKFPDIETKSYRFQKAEIEKDSDQDGLSDITEALFQLDPQNPDSDQDGKNDGEDKNPLSRPRSPSSDEDTLAQAIFARYGCEEEGQPIFVQQPEAGPLELSPENCKVLPISKAQIDAYLTPDGQRRYDRSIDVLRFVYKIKEDTAKIKVGNDIADQVWVFKREGAGWVFFRKELPEIYDK